MRTAIGTARSRAVRLLRFVRAAQSIGLTLGEIRGVLAFRDRGEEACDHVLGMIEGHIEELGERIGALEAMRSDLLRLARRSQHTPPRAAAFCRIIEDVASELPEHGTSRPDAPSTLRSGTGSSTGIEAPL